MRISQFLICHLAVLWYLTVPAHATPPNTTQLIEAGNASYQSGAFADAAQKYQQAIASGVNNGHLFYNLANAHYRLGNIGHAIANYRRALVELPGNADAIANLQLARKQVKDKLDQGEVESLLASWNIAGTLSPSTRELIFLGLYCLSFASLGLAYALQDKRIFQSALALGFIAGIFGFGVFGFSPGRLGHPQLSVLSHSPKQIPAVIVAKQADVRAGDSNTFQKIFVLHEGSEILSRDRRNGWTEIILPGGRQGWVEDSSLEVI